MLLAAKSVYCCKMKFQKSREQFFALYKHIEHDLFNNFTPTKFILNFAVLNAR